MIPIPINPSLDVPESSEKREKQKSKKPYCYRCRTKGHVNTECTVVLFCDVCHGDHAKKACPNLENLNFTAIPCGYAVEGLGFYFIPMTDTPKVTPVDTSAVVRVLEGSLSADQLAVELDRLLPGNSWVIDLKGTDAFTTMFPSAEVLNHMVNWGTMDAKSVPAKIRFERAVDNEVYKYEIPKVWVQFRGLPTELRKFPIIWAVGSILGVPRAVDTIFTKKFGRPRMRVAVLNPDIIPPFVDVVIGDFVYELQFKVEKDLNNGEPYVIDMDTTRDEDKDPEEDGDPEDMDLDGKNNGGKKVVQKENRINTESVAPNEQLNKSCDIGAHTDPPNKSMVEVVTTGRNSKPMVLLSPTGLNPDGTAQWKASTLQNKIDSGTIVKEYGVCKGTGSPSRSSKRTAATSAQDSMEKAKAAKARKNLDHATLKGKDTQPISFNSFDNSFILQSAAALGVSFGSNDIAVSSSLHKLKELESVRMSTFKPLEGTHLEVDDLSSVCSLDDRMDLEALNFICSKISEELGDGGCDTLDVQTSLSRSKKGGSKGAKKSNKISS